MVCSTALKHFVAHNNIARVHKIIATIKIRHQTATLLISNTLPQYPTD